MPDIKTREVDRTLKIRDAAARLPKELVHDIAVKIIGIKHFRKYAVRR